MAKQHLTPTGDGIHKLLTAEAEAAKIVAEARKVRGSCRVVNRQAGAPGVKACLCISTEHHRQPAAAPPPNQPQAKQERLKQAKAEAEREIAAYKAEREGAYQKKLAEVIMRGSRGEGEGHECLEVVCS